MLPSRLIFQKFARLLPWRVRSRNYPYPLPFPIFPPPRDLRIRNRRRRRWIGPSSMRPKRLSLTIPLPSPNLLPKSSPKCLPNRSKIYQKSISDCSLVSTSLFYKFLITFSLNNETSNPQNHLKTSGFVMFLHIRPFQIYDTCTCDSCQTK